MESEQPHAVLQQGEEETLLIVEGDQDGTSYTLVEDVVVDDEEAAQILAAVEANGDGAEVHEYWRCDCQQLFLSENALKKHQHEEHGVPIHINKRHEGVDVHGTQINASARLVAAMNEAEDGLMEDESEAGSVSQSLPDGRAQDGTEIWRCGVQGCDKAFLTRGGRSKHRRSFHPNVFFENPKAGRFACGHCGQINASMLDLCRHLRDEHQEPAIVRCMKFCSAEEFNAWKQDIELTSKERFVQRKGTKQLKTCAVSSLMCHHSGFYRDRATIRNRRSSGTGKMQSHCSAFIDAYLFKKDGTVEVTCCLHHYGHRRKRGRPRGSAKTTATTSNSNTNNTSSPASSMQTRSATAAGSEMDEDGRPTKSMTSPRLAMGRNRPHNKDDSSVYYMMRKVFDSVGDDANPARGEAIEVLPENQLMPGDATTSLGTPTTTTLTSYRTTPRKSAGWQQSTVAAASSSHNDDDEEDIIAEITAVQSAPEQNEWLNQNNASLQMRSLRQRHTIYSVRDDLAKGAATIVAKDGAKQTTECWQVFGQVVTLAGERLPFVACRRCLTPYADDPSGSTGNLIRHLAKCQNSDSTATQISSPEMMPTKDVVIKKEPLNDSEMDNASDSDAFALSSISQEAALEAALSVRDQLQPVALTPRRVKERLSKEELIIVYKTGVKQTTECWQVIGQVATTEGIPLPFLACRRCLQVYSDDPNGSTSTLNRHLLRCTATAATNGKNGGKLLSPKEEEMEDEEGEECEERPTGSAISLQDSIVPMPVYQDHDDAQEEIELDQAQSIGLAAIDVLFGAGATRSSRPKTPNGSDQWSCEVAGCPLTFLTRNGMLKHCRKKHSLSKRNAQPILVGKPNAATLMTMQLREASAAALPVQGVVLENSPPTSSTSRWADAPHLPPPTITTNASSTRFRCSVDGCFRQFLTANGMRKHRRKCHSSVKHTDGRSIRWSKPMSSKVSSMNGFSASKAGSQLKQTKSFSVTRVASAANGFHRQEEASNQLTTSTLYDSFPSGVKLIAHDPIHQVTCAPPFVPEMMMQQESHPAEAVVVNEPDAGQPGAYFVDPTCPSPVSISPSRVSQPPASWLEEVSAALQAIRACAVACQSSDRGRQRISDAVDDLWDICDKARRDVKVEKQRILQTS